MSVDEIDTGVMNDNQSKELAISMIVAADELLRGIDDDASDALTVITEKLSE